MARKRRKNASSEEEHDWLSPDYVDRWVNDRSNDDKRLVRLRQVALALPFPLSKKIRVLDVGGGWGPLSEQVLIHRPNAQVMLVDISERMLEHARTFLLSYRGRVRFERRDLRRPGWRRGLGGPFDAVVSSQAIHNLDEPKLIRAVYSDVLRLLKPHSFFFNMEVIFSPTSRLRKIRSSIYDALDDGETEEEEGAADPRTVENQLKWLRSAGFREVDCLWLEDDKALLCGSS